MTAIRGTAAPERPARGQTHIDFVFGVSIFLLTTAFVVGSVPGMLDSSRDHATPVVADRVADELVEDHLAASGPTARPGVVNESCTVAFFTQTQRDGCGFDADAPIPAQLGVSRFAHVNVTLAWNVSGDPDLEPLCHGDDDGDGVDDVVRCDAAGAEEPLTVGPTVRRDQGAVETARRTVTVDGRLATAVIRVW